MLLVKLKITYNKFQHSQANLLQFKKFITYNLTTDVLNFLDNKANFEPSQSYKSCKSYETNKNQLILGSII